MKDESIILELYDIGAIKFGNFTLKNGSQSSIYIDLRIIVSYPIILQKISDMMMEKIKDCSYDYICGVPYTALPIATGISLKYNKPMVMRRKEKKDYGTKKMIEGNYEKNKICLVIEDVITTGSSVMETVEELNKVSLKVYDTVVFINRGEKTKLDNVDIYSCFTISEIINILIKNKKINYRLKYSERKSLTDNHILKKLFTIIENKKSNLCLSADLTNKKDIINLIHKCGPYICLLKTHIDIISDFTSDFTKTLKSLSEKYNFLIFEDRKFADIGNTVKYQYYKGIYRISKWADIINCHILCGPSIIKGLSANAILLIAQMSTQENLLNELYQLKCIEYAERFKHVIGFITMKNITPDHADLINMTPGVSLNVSGDDLGQQYKTPDTVISQNGSDIIIVGRGIYNSDNPELMAKKYKEQGWNAYLKSLKLKYKSNSNDNN